MNIFHTSRLPTGLKPETLARMVRTLLLRLVDDNLGKQPEGEALLKVRSLQKPQQADAQPRQANWSAGPATQATTQNRLGSAAQRFRMQR
jgi:hypothetical protein